MRRYTLALVICLMFTGCLYQPRHIASHAEICWDLYGSLGKTPPWQSSCNPENRVPSYYSVMSAHNAGKATHRYQVQRRLNRSAFRNPYVRAGALAESVLRTLESSD
jgi:hypothetical protein